MTLVLLFPKRAGRVYAGHPSKVFRIILGLNKVF
jgi:hypothetical protein